MSWYRPTRPSKNWIPARDVGSKAPKWSSPWWLDQVQDVFELFAYFLPL